MFHCDKFTKNLPCYVQKVMDDLILESGLSPQEYLDKRFKDTGAFILVSELRPQSINDILDCIEYYTIVCNDLRQTKFTDIYQGITETKNIYRQRILIMSGGVK
jgi:hypothetical protein